jgi:hypothetical protein
MKKFCVFCGKRPISKTSEHVIPEWLIKHTGDPNRKGRFGFDRETRKPREFSFDEFKFPACDQCNNDFNILEKAVKPIVINILQEEAMSDELFRIFLTWLDKIRIGLWLGHLYLDKNLFGVFPHFFIESRIDTADRMVLIYKTSDRQKGIFMFGVENPFFSIRPSHFWLGLNQFHFVNISSDFLFSRRLGLPFLDNLIWSKKEGAQGQLMEGKKRIFFPLIRKHYDKSCTEIYQPIINPGLQDHKFYNNEYIRNFFDKSSNQGRILMSVNGKVIKYGGMSKKWIPSVSHSRLSITKISVQTLEVFQNIFVKETPDLKSLGGQEKVVKLIISQSKKFFNDANEYLNGL